jgi:hypothetical protein
MNICVKAPAELRAPWTRNVTNEYVSNWMLTPAHEEPMWPLPQGYDYLMLVRANFQDSSGNTLKLLSGCSENCTSCLAGTGLAYGRLEEALPRVCEVTREGGTFAMWYNAGDGASNTHEKCVDSLDAYYASLEKQSLLMLLGYIVFGGLAFVVLVIGIFFYWHIRKTRHLFEKDIRLAISEGRAEFRMIGGSSGRSVSLDEPYVSGQHERRVVQQSEIEALFPAKTCTAACRHDPCVVCLQPLEGKLVRQLQCDHVIHADCILSWWLHRPNTDIHCPICRQPQQIPENQASLTQQQEESQRAATSFYSNTEPAPEVIGSNVHV